MGDFYMTLPSNVKSNLFNNTLANYNTKLANPISLENKWEVGLSSISYTKSWMNVADKQYIEFVYFYKGKHFVRHIASIRKGLYLSIESLIEHINKAISIAQGEANKETSKKFRYLYENPEEFSITDKKAQNLHTIAIHKIFNNKDKLDGVSLINEYGQHQYNKKELELTKYIKIEVEKELKKDEENYKKAVSKSDVSSKLTTKDEIYRKLSKVDNDLINACNITLPIFSYDSHYKTTAMESSTYKNSYVYMCMTPQLYRMLGYDGVEHEKKISNIMFKLDKEYSTLETNDKRAAYKPDLAKLESKIYSTAPNDLNANFHSLFLYCNVMKPTYVGDSLTQLLRFIEVPTNASFGEQVVITYPNIHYVPVLFNNFDSIEIDIKDDTGDTIPFLYGRTICTLHFRENINRN